MSYELTKWALNEPGLTTYEKIVLAIIADIHNKTTDLCYPSAPTVANIAGCTEKVVRNCLKSLEVKGKINLTARSGTTPLITFNWQTPEGDTGVPRNEVPDLEETTPVPDTGHSGTRDRTPRNEIPDPPVRGTDEQRNNKEVNKEEGWQPSAAAMTSLRDLFGKEFELPGHWLNLFAVKVESNDIPEQRWNAYFIEWAQYQQIKDQKISKAKTEIPADEPRAAGRNYESPKHEDSNGAQLRHAKTMLAQMEKTGNAALIGHWKAQVAELKLQGGAREQISG